MTSQPTVATPGIVERIFIKNTPVDDFHFICIDVEASGSTHSDMLLAVGVGVVRLSDLKPVRTLLLVLAGPTDMPSPMEGKATEKPDDWEESTWNEFWNNGTTRTDGRTPYSALADVRDTVGYTDRTTASGALRAFFASATASVARWSIVSDNISYDASHIKWLLIENGLPDLDYIGGSYVPLFDYADYNKGVALLSPALPAAKKKKISSYDAACDALAAPEDERILHGVEHDHIPDNDALVGAHKAAVVARASIKRYEENERKRKHDAAK